MSEPLENEHSEALARLRSLEEVPPRQPEVAERGRRRFLAEARTLRQAVSPWSIRRLMEWVGKIKTKEISVMTLRTSPALRYVAAIAIVVVLLGGTVATAYAAQGALPGSALYGLKTGLERARLALAIDASREARLHLQFAENRLDELAGLVAAGRFGELEEAVEAFEAHLRAAIESLGVIARGDPLEAQRVAVEITDALSRFARILMDLAALVPPEAQGPLLRALEASSGEFELELEESDANENRNDNVGQNLNENANQNANANGNVNGNANLNGNANDDDDDDDENDNDDDANDNDDDDDEDDNENENENDNDNMNENRNENSNQGSNNNKNSNSNGG